MGVPPRLQMGGGIYRPETIMDILKTLNQHLTKFTTQYMSTRLVFALDFALSVLSSLVTIGLMRFIVSASFFSSKVILIWSLSSLIFSFLYIWIFRTYRIIIRHTTIRELGLFALVSLCKVLSMCVVFGFAVVFSTVLYVMVIADFFITFLAFFILRMSMILVYNIVINRQEHRRKAMNVLIYGVDVRSVSMISRLCNSSAYNIVGFLQYGKTSVSHVISELKVFYVGSEDELNKVVEQNQVDAILFASDTDILAERDRIIKTSIDNGVKILVSPSIDELEDGRTLHTIKNIDIEDLLMRPEIKISMSEIKANFSGKTVMVTGAAGSIGSELCLQIATLGVRKLILFDNAETPMHELRLELEEKYPDLNFVPIIGDVRILARLDYVFRRWNPQVVFHAAAYKHVPLMEDNPCEAVLVNVAGSRNVADKCIEYGVEMMVMVSTDKAVNPTNIMGCTKRLAEIYVQSLGLAVENGKLQGKTKFVTTRFGNVLGSNGSVIPRFRAQIAAGGPLTVTHPEITRFFMTIPEACRLVMEAATMSCGNQIFVFDMGEPVKIDDLARRMIRLAGFVPDKDIKVVYTGLRPGEKLYEEVLSNHENTIPTDHSSIRIANVRKYSYEDALSVVEELERLSRLVEVSDMVRLMKATVPEYISRNSQLEEFDKN